MSLTGSVTTGRSTLQFNLPKGFYYHRAPGSVHRRKWGCHVPKGGRVGTYSYRFGAVKHVAMPNQPVVQPGTRQDTSAQTK